MTITYDQIEALYSNMTEGDFVEIESKDPSDIGIITAEIHDNSDNITGKLILTEDGTVTDRK